MKWRVVVATVIYSISLSLLVSCGGGDGQSIRGFGNNTGKSAANANSGTPASSQTNEDASVAATALAQRILSPQSSDDAQQAVSQVLAWAGIGTMANGSLQPAKDPTLPTFVAPAELAFLTQDASLRADASGQMTLAEFADVLQQSGAWDASGSTDPGQTLLDVLRDALTLAKQQPHDTHSFVPLFLAAMAEHGSPGKKLDDPATLPTDVILSALEQELFLSAMLRGDESYPVPSAAAAVRIAAASGTPPICDQFLQSMGPLQGFESGALGAVSPSPFTKLFEKFGVASPKINLLSNLLNVLKVIMSSTDNSVSFSITPAPAEQRKPTYYGDTNYINYTADVNVNGAQRDPTKLSELDSCAQALGFTLPDTADMIAEQINSWRVMWYPLDGTGDNQWAKQDADINFLETEPTYITAVQSDSPDHGTSNNRLIMNHQTEPYGPFTETGKILMRAELDQSGTPDFVKDLFSMVTGNVWEGAVSAITDMLTHWGQRIATRKTFATVEGEQYGAPAYVTYQYQFDAPCKFSVRGSGYLKFSSDVTPPEGAKHADFFVRVVGEFIARIPVPPACGDTTTKVIDVDYSILNNIVDGAGVQSVPQGEEATEDVPPDQETYGDDANKGSIHIGRFFSIVVPVTIGPAKSEIDTVPAKDTINDIVLEAKEGATVTVPLQDNVGSMTYTYTEKTP